MKLIDRAQLVPSRQTGAGSVMDSISYLMRHLDSTLNEGIDIPLLTIHARCPFHPRYLKVPQENKLKFRFAKDYLLSAMNRGTELSAPS